MQHNYQSLFCLLSFAVHVCSLKKNVYSSVATKFDNLFEHLPKVEASSSIASPIAIQKSKQKLLEAIKCQGRIAEISNQRLTFNDDLQSIGRTSYSTVNHTAATALHESHGNAFLKKHEPCISYEGLSTPLLLRSLSRSPTGPSYGLILPNRSPALRGSPDWVPTGSFIPHMARQRKRAIETHQKQLRSKLARDESSPFEGAIQSSVDRSMARSEASVNLKASYPNHGGSSDIMMHDPASAFGDQKRQHTWSSKQTDKVNTKEIVDSLLLPDSNSLRKTSNAKQLAMKNGQDLFRNEANIQSNRTTPLPTHYSSNLLKVDSVRSIEGVAHPYHSDLYFPTYSQDNLGEKEYEYRAFDDIASEVADLVDTAMPSENSIRLSSSSGQLIGRSPTSSSPEIMRYGSPVKLQDFVPAPTVRAQSFLRYRAPMDRFFRSISNDIIYDNWWVQWSRTPAARYTSAQVANELGFVDVGAGLRDGVTQVNTGWRDIIFQSYTNRANQEVSAGLAKGKYGVFVDRSNLYRATAVEVLARHFAIATMTDFISRSYGVHFRIRHFEISVMHDFDEYLFRDPSQYATEILVAYRHVGIAISSDVADASYGISIGVRGRRVSLQHDFDDRTTELLANWGRGWQLVMESDFIDPISQEIYFRAGFGRISRAFFSVGFGVGNDGMLEASVEAQLPDVALYTRFLDVFGERVLQNYITIGKFTYIWRSASIPQNLRLPNILGLNPDQIKHFLLGSRPFIK